MNSRETERACKVGCALGIVRIMCANQLALSSSFARAAKGSYRVDCPRGLERWPTTVLGCLFFCKGSLFHTCHGRMSRSGAFRCAQCACLCRRPPEEAVTEASASSGWKMNASLSYRSSLRAPIECSMICSPA
jgi:hypothetical protein